MMHGRFNDPWPLLPSTKLLFRRNVRGCFLANFLFPCAILIRAPRNWRNTAETAQKETRGNKAIYPSTQRQLFLSILQEWDM